jgi:hypothetical protein
MELSGYIQLLKSWKWQNILAGTKGQKIHRLIMDPKKMLLLTAKVLILLMHILSTILYMMWRNIACPDVWVTIDVCLFSSFHNLHSRIPKDIFIVVSSWLYRRIN